MGSEKSITRIVELKKDSMDFHPKILVEEMGVVKSSLRSLDKKNIFKVDDREEIINIKNTVKKTISKIFSARNIFSK